MNPRIFNRKRVVLLAASFLLALAAIMLGAWYCTPRGQFQTRFFPGPNGTLLAELRGHSGSLNLPLVRHTGVSVTPIASVWRDGNWQVQQIIDRAGWGATRGYYMVVRVPDVKWKVEMQVAPQLSLQLGHNLFKLPVRTNIVLAREFPPRKEIEKWTNAPLEHTSTWE